MTIALDLQDHFHLSKHEMGVLRQIMAATEAGASIKEITALIMAAGLTSEDIDRLSGCVAQVAEVGASKAIEAVTRADVALLMSGRLPRSPGGGLLLFQLVLLGLR